MEDRLKSKLNPNEHLTLSSVFDKEKPTGPGFHTGEHRIYITPVVTYEYTMHMYYHERTHAWQLKHNILLFVPKVLTEMHANLMADLICMSKFKCSIEDLIHTKRLSYAYDDSPNYAYPDRVLIDYKGPVSCRATWNYIESLTGKDFHKEAHVSNITAEMKLFSHCLRFPNRVDFVEKYFEEVGLSYIRSPDGNH
jgi:hypothetical protein